MKIINILPQTIHREKYLITRNESNLILLTLLKDKCFQLYNKYVKIDQSMIDYAKQEASNPQKSGRFPGWDLTDDHAIKIFIGSLLRFSGIFKLYATELPGFHQISKNDLEIIIKERRNVIFGMRSYELFINDECYLIESGVQICRKRMNALWTANEIEMIFKFSHDIKRMKFSPNEISLLIPVLLTAPQSNIQSIVFLMKRILQIILKFKQMKFLIKNILIT